MGFLRPFRAATLVTCVLGRCPLKQTHTRGATMVSKHAAALLAISTLLVCQVACRPETAEPDGGQGVRGPGLPKRDLQQLVDWVRAQRLWCVSGRVVDVQRGNAPGSQAMGYILEDVTDPCGVGVTPPPTTLVIAGSSAWDESDDYFPYCTSALDCRVYRGRVFALVSPEDLGTNGRATARAYWNQDPSLPAFHEALAWIVDVDPQGNSALKSRENRGVQLVESMTLEHDALVRGFGRAVATGTLQEPQRCQALNCPEGEECAFGEACVVVTRTGTADPCPHCEVQ